MVETVLIANRGEIARRVMRSCRSAGLRTVAVYSDADAELPHVGEADMAVAIGPAAARESYLRADRILDALGQTGADAVHPGYGFLSENADFAEAVTARGAVWIGPAPETIRDMGDKQRAREIAQAAGVPVVPGSRRFPSGDIEGLEVAAQEVGFPLLVKASAGGGGIGMRRVDDRAVLHETVEATQSMAANAFGDGTVFLERFIPRARHVEVQVFGFGNGEAI
ncbi:MAG: acetyl-CoA carboxylase biotin carboxylase subunit, partial [Hyphomicrobiales bacterium]|nr:acetyl-CoA carboxylase biotin carboxylase subunit [Hyphomicrobiales bacterium]